MAKARKYSSKGISTSPKTLKKFTSAVNKLLWRKYQLVRSEVGVDETVLASAFENGVAALTVVEDAVKS
jgi:hypothetical protein